MPKQSVIQQENIELKSQLQEANIRLARAEAKASYFETEYERVIQALKQAQREKFAATSERFVDECTQLPLFGAEKEPESDSDNGDNSTSTDEIEEITYTRRKKGTKQADLAAIPVREVIIPVAEKDRICACGCTKELIRYAEKSKLHYVPATLEIILEKREVLACRKGCDSSIQIAPVPAVALPKCKATEELLAHIIIAKILDRQPLYHLEKKFERQYDWRIPRQTMARWMIQLADPLQPLINLMKDELSSYDVAACDATSLQVLNEPARDPTRKSYTYCLRGGPPGKEIILFEYNAYNQKDYLEETFTGFNGFIHTDADGVYDKVAQNPEITLSLCHAHARRKFEQIYQAARKKDGLAKHALKVYQELYQIERQAKDQGLSAAQRYTLRQEKSKPLLAAFKIWLDDKSELVLPRSPLGKAIAYTRNNWPGLLTFLADGRLSPDNNATENQIRPFVIARKNFMFACTMAGADALGIHFSLALTAKHHGLNPYHYYVQVLKAIPHCQSPDDFAKLLPWNLKNQPL